MRAHPSSSRFWSFVYQTYPRFLRALETLKIHHSRQPHLLGKLAPGKYIQDLENHLESQGYESAILAWKDPGELISMRKIDNDIYQYHVRVFVDGEIRGHYEYSSEGNPLGHVLEWRFEPRTEDFKNALADFLV